MEELCENCKQQCEECLVKQELELVKQELVESKRTQETMNASMTNFWRDVNHEVRTPLNAIINFPEIILNDNRHLSAEQRKYLFDVKICGENLYSIFLTGLEFYRIETGEIAVKHNDVVSLRDFIPSLAKTFSNRVSAPIEFYHSLDRILQQKNVLLNHYLLKKVFNCLLENAIKFTHKGFVQIGGRVVGNKLQFFIEDTGIGIAQEYYEQIFKRTFRITHPDATVIYSGVGLGLYLCKKYVELMEGRIWVESELNKGSTFIFEIPYRPDGDAQVPLDTTFSLKGRKVLIVEDDLMSLKVLDLLLIALDAIILKAENANQALRLFDIHNPDLILLDIKLPDMDGYELFQKIRGCKPNVPIIAQTAYDDREKIITLGFDDYLPKPIQQHDFLCAVQKVFV